MVSQKWMHYSPLSSKKPPGRPSVHASAACRQKAYRMRLKQKGRGVWKRRPYTCAERAARYRHRRDHLRTLGVRRKLLKEMTVEEMGAFRRAHLI